RERREAHRLRGELLPARRHVVLQARRVAGGRAARRRRGAGVRVTALPAQRLRDGDEAGALALDLPLRAGHLDEDLPPRGLRDDAEQRVAVAQLAAHLLEGALDLDAHALDAEERERRQPREFLLIDRRLAELTAPAIDVVEQAAARDR